MFSNLYKLQHQCTSIVNIIPLHYFHITFHAKFVSLKKTKTSSVHEHIFKNF